MILFTRALKILFNIYWKAEKYLSYETVINLFCSENINVA